MISDAWLAVQYPDGARFDLGLYEMLLTIPLAVGFLILRRRPRPWGFYMGMMTVYYAPYRFALDFLRARDLQISDERYLDLTPAQWACVFLFAYGAVTLFRAFESAGEPRAWAVPVVAPPRSQGSGA
jgi:phosphatidylglycerol:prolipoprotein diacylglycerol transferase